MLACFEWIMPVCATGYKQRMPTLLPRDHWRTQWRTSGEWCEESVWLYCHAVSTGGRRSGLLVLHTYHGVLLLVSVLGESSCCYWPVRWVESVRETASRAGQGQRSRRHSGEGAVSQYDTLSRDTHCENTIQLTSWPLGTPICRRFIHWLLGLTNAWCRVFQQTVIMCGWTPSSYTPHVTLCGILQWRSGSQWDIPVYPLSVGETQTEGTVDVFQAISRLVYRDLESFLM